MYIEKVVTVIQMFNKSIFERMMPDEVLRQKVKAGLSAMDMRACMDADQQLIKILASE
jgi:hypothetical protein